jgi:hypothetical protein
MFWINQFIPSKFNGLCHAHLWSLGIWIRCVEKRACYIFLRFHRIIELYMGHTPIFWLKLENEGFLPVALKHPLCRMLNWSDFKAVLLSMERGPGKNKVGKRTKKIRQEGVSVSLGFYLWVLYPLAHLSNWFFMMPSIATKFQYVNSLFYFLSHSLHVSAPTDHLQARYTIRYFKDYF